jgi:hypothetical protein
MLNLKELETALDNALASETPESLKSWLQNIRESRIESIIGQSDSFNFPGLMLHDVAIISESPNLVTKMDQSADCETMYLAA